jgi:hypothetical protein
MREGLPQDMQAIRGDWQAVGDYLSEAMHAVAIDSGGEEFATKVSDLAATGELLPNPDALKILEETYPGSAEIVMARMAEIQQEVHKRELAELRKPSIRRYGEAILKGFEGLNIFGFPPRRP